MKVKLTFYDTFDSEFNGITYKIYQFVNPITFEIINAVNLDTSIKLISDTLYKCTIDRRGKKWKVINVEKLD